MTTARRRPSPHIRPAPTSIESVLPLDSRHLAVLNDNNYPGSAGRVPGQPDPDEFIIIRLDRPLPRFRDDDGNR